MITLFSADIEVAMLNWMSKNGEEKGGGGSEGKREK